MHSIGGFLMEMVPIKEVSALNSGRRGRDILTRFAGDFQGIQLSKLMSEALTSNPTRHTNRHFLTGETGGECGSERRSGASSGRGMAVHAMLSFFPVFDC